MTMLFSLEEMSSDYHFSIHSELELAFHYKELTLESSIVFLSKLMHIRTILVG